MSWVMLHTFFPYASMNVQRHTHEWLKKMQGIKKMQETLTVKAVRKICIES